MQLRTYGVYLWGNYEVFMKYLWSIVGMESAYSRDAIGTESA